MSRIALKTAFAAAGNQGAVDPEFIVWWSGGFPTVKDGTDPTSNASVTISYHSSVPSGQVVSFATSYEQVNWAPGTPYICFGSYDRYQNTPSGGVIDFSNRSNWVYYGGKDGSNRYTFPYSSSGGSYQEMGIANNNGSVMFNRPISSQTRVFDIDAYTYLQGPSFFYSMRFHAPTDLLYAGNGTQITVYDWSGTTLSTLRNLTGTFAGDDIAISPDGNYIAVGGTTSIKIYDNRSTGGALTQAFDVNGLAGQQSVGGFSDVRRIEFSPDSTKLLVTGDGGSYSSTGGYVMVFDLDSSTCTAMTVPVGGSNDKINGCAWFPDNDRYAIGGYSGAVSHIGSYSSGGYLSEYGTFSAQGGVVVIPFEDA